MPRARVYWIRLEDGVHDHPKTIEVSAALEIPREQVVGHLTRLWIWLLRYRPSGSLKGLSDEVIAEAAGWSVEKGGIASAFVDALRSARFITGGDRKPVAHGWAEHNGRQIREAERKARNRALQRRGKGADKTAKDAPESADATQRNATGRDEQEIPPELRDSSERGGESNGGREILTDQESLATATAYIRDLTELVREIPKLSHLQSAVKKLEPVGVYQDSGRSVLQAPKDARDRLKGNPEFQTVQILLKRRNR